MEVTMKCLKKTVLTLLVALYGVAPMSAFRIGSTEFTIDLGEGKKKRIVKINHDIHAGQINKKLAFASKENIDEIINESNQSKKRMFLVEKTPKDLFLGKITQTCKKKNIPVKNIDPRYEKTQYLMVDCSLDKKRTFLNDVISLMHEKIQNLKKYFETCENQKLKTSCLKKLNTNFSDTELKKIKEKTERLLKKEWPLDWILTSLACKDFSQLLDLNALLEIDILIKKGFDLYICAGLSHGEKIAETIKQSYNIEDCKEEGTTRDKDYSLDLELTKKILEEEEEEEKEKKRKHLAYKNKIKNLTKKIATSAAVAGGIGYGTYRLVKWWWNRK